MGCWGKRALGVLFAYATISTMRILLTLLLSVSAAAVLPAAKTLDVYFIDVEGGQSTLIISPSGESLLVDTGWPGGRDAGRIAAVAKKAGLKRIDYVLVTHYHLDHVGGLPELAELIPIVNFVDHGENLEDSKGARELYEKYVKVREKGKHILVKPGDRLPIKGIDVQVVAAAGERITTPLAGAGQPNPLCSAASRRPVDTSENGKSVGNMLTFGKFRLVNLADLTWNKEIELVCPNNLVGTVDLYLVTHHGMNLSGSPVIVHAIKPRVAVMNNGARKGASPEAWETVHTSPGLEGFWQLHYAVANGKEKNVSEEYIANLEEKCEGHYLKLSAQRNGTFTVTNTRNGLVKTYR